MDQMQLLLWSQRMSSQGERSRAAHVKHLRAEQARQARDAQPTVMSVLARAWKALAGGTRASVEPGLLPAER
jgi:hypothetical protein